MSLIVVEAIRGRCARFMILTATVSEIFGGQTNPSILDVSFSSQVIGDMLLKYVHVEMEQDCLRYFKLICIFI